jgi:hypothetical protein
MELHTTPPAYLLCTLSRTCEAAAMHKYIAGQGEHHRNIWFQDELRSLFGRYALAFDEQHVWD